MGGNNFTVSDIFNWDVGSLTSLLNISEVLNVPERPPEFQPPTHVLSDYLEIGSLAVILPFGTVFNLMVLRKLFNNYQHRTNMLHQRDVKSAFLLLKIHLTVANLLVILLDCPIKIGWLATYRWIAGPVICKLCQFAISFSLYISSNMVTCIAIDKMHIVWRLCSKSSQVNATPANSIGHVKQLLICAWTLALLCSSPQLIVWNTLYLLPSWAQCTTVWMIRQVTGVSDDGYPISYKAYQIFHLVMVFWLPFVVILFCYSFIAYKLASYACSPFERPSSQAIRMVEMNSLNESTVTTPQATRISSNYQPHNSIATDLNESTTNNEQSFSLPPRSNTYTAVSTAIKHNRESERSQSQKRTDENSETSSLLLSQRPSTTARGPAIPAWRIQMRSKMFKTTAAVVTCYTVCWFPYNVLGWLMLYDVQLTNRLSEELDWLKSMILINSVLNPIIYGFSND